jgi:dihydroorotate dehydrogenase (NAD+) catalytic subunit
MIPRSPARLPRFLPYPGGVLLHTGHPNPGLRTVLQRYAVHWARASVPIIVHLLANQSDETTMMVEKLEICEGVIAIELGLPDEIGDQEAYELTSSAQGELAVLVRLPIHKALELVVPVLEAGAAAISIAPPRGTLPDLNGEFISGRLYGPNLFPQALEVVQRLCQQGREVIGAGGIYTRTQAQAMLDAGARAVQLDTVLWRSDFNAKDFNMSDKDTSVQSPGASRA